MINKAYGHNRLFLCSSKMPDVGRVVSMSILLYGLVAWATYIAGCGIALSETITIV